MKRNFIALSLCVLALLASLLYDNLSDSVSPITPSYNTTSRDEAPSLNDLTPTPQGAALPRPSHHAPIATLNGYVVDKGNSPIKGATLLLRSDRSEYSTQSDDQGAFSFREVGEDSYIISASKTGYAPTTQEVSIGGNDNTKDISLVLGEEGVLRGIVQCLQNDAIISLGIVPYSPEPRQPVIGGDIRRIEQCTYRVETLPEEAFEITGVVPGTYTLICGFADVSLTREKVVITSGEPTELSLDLTRGGSMSGRVFSAKTAQTKPTRVLLKRFIRERDERGFLIGEQEGIVATCTIDQDGNYLLDEIPAGSYLLRLDTEDEENSLSYISSRVVDLPVAGRLRKNIQQKITTGSSLRGQCTLDGKASFTTIVLTHITEPEHSRSEMINPDGVFNVGGLEEGSYHILFIDPLAMFNGQLKAAQSSAYIASGSADAYVSEHYASISLSGKFIPDGSLSDDAFASTRVELELVLEHNVASTGIIRATSTLDETGAFTFGALANGTYKVTVLVSGKAVVEREVALSSDMHLILQAQE